MVFTFQLSLPITFKSTHHLHQSRDRFVKFLEMWSWFRWWLDKETPSDLFHMAAATTNLANHKTEFPSAHCRKLSQSYPWQNMLGYISLRNRVQWHLLLNLAGLMEGLMRFTIARRLICVFMSAHMLHLHKLPSTNMSSTCNLNNWHNLLICRKFKDFADSRTTCKNKVAHSQQSLLFEHNYLVSGGLCVVLFQQFQLLRILSNFSASEW
jgi:hypothetical protein